MDYSQYLNWEKVVAPSGAVYYKVPDTAYLYDPFLSSQKGRPVLFQDPRPQLAEKEAAQKQQQDLVDLQKQQASPMGQIVPVVGSVAGTVGGAWAANALAGSGAAAGAGAAGAGAAGATGAATGAGTAGATGAAAGGTAATTGAATGTGAAAGGTAAGGSSAAGSASASDALAAWPLIVAWAGYNSFKNFQSAKKAAKGGALTDEEATSIFHPNSFGQNKYTDKLPYGKQARKLGDMVSPAVIASKLIWGSNKHEDQLWRDRARKSAEEKGFAQVNENGSHVVTLADGSKYDIGVDGIERGQMGQAYNVDLNNPIARKMAGQLQPLALALVGDTTGDPKRREKLVSDMTGYLTNAAMSNGDPEANLRKMYADAGITDKATGSQLLTAIKDAGALDEEGFKRYNDALDQIYDPNYNFGEKPWWENTPEIPEYAKAAQVPASQEEQQQKEMATMDMQQQKIATGSQVPVTAQQAFAGMQTQPQIMGGVQKPLTSEQIAGVAQLPNNMGFQPVNYQPALQQGYLPYPVNFAPSTGATNWANGLATGTPVLATQPAQPVVAAPLTDQARTETLSPGIGLDGKPIDYGKLLAERMNSRK